MDPNEYAAIQQAGEDGAVCDYLTPARLLAQLPPGFDREQVRRDFEASGPLQPDAWGRVAYVCDDRVPEGKCRWLVRTPADDWPAYTLIILINHAAYVRVIAQLRQLTEQKRAAIGLN